MTLPTPSGIVEGLHDVFGRRKGNRPTASRTHEDDVLHRISAHVEETNGHAVLARRHLESHVFSIYGNREGERLLVTLDLDGAEARNVRVEMRRESDDYGYPATKSDLQKVRSFITTNVQQNPDKPLRVADFNSLQGFDIDPASLLGAVDDLIGKKKLELSSR